MSKVHGRSCFFRALRSQIIMIPHPPTSIPRTTHSPLKSGTRQRALARLSRVDITLSPPHLHSSLGPAPSLSHRVSDALPPITSHTPRPPPTVSVRQTPVKITSPVLHFPPISPSKSSSPPSLVAATSSPAGPSKTPVKDDAAPAVGSGLRAIRILSTPVGAGTLALPEEANAAVRFHCLFCSYKSIHCLLICIALQEQMPDANAATSPTRRLDFSTLDARKSDDEVSIQLPEPPSTASTSDPSKRPSSSISNDADQRSVPTV